MNVSKNAPIKPINLTSTAYSVILTVERVMIMPIAPLAIVKRCWLLMVIAK